VTGRRVKPELYFRLRRAKRETFTKEEQSKKIFFLLRKEELGERGRFPYAAFQKKKKKTDIFLAEGREGGKKEFAFLIEEKNPSKEKREKKREGGERFFTGN